MRITNEEIEYLRDYVTGSYFFDIHDELYEMLDRLKELEKAVVFNGFDKLPDDNFYVDVRSSDGRVSTFYFDADTLEFETDDADKTWTKDQMVDRGYTGWRYPVEDMS